MSEEIVRVDPGPLPEVRAEAIEENLSPGSAEMIHILREF